MPHPDQGAHRVAAQGRRDRRGTGPGPCPRGHHTQVRHSGRAAHELARLRPGHARPGDGQAVGHRPRRLRRPGRRRPARRVRAAAAGGPAPGLRTSPERRTGAPGTPGRGRPGHPPLRATGPAARPHLRPGGGHLGQPRPGERTEGGARPDRPSRPCARPARRRRRLSAGPDPGRGAPRSGPHSLHPPQRPLPARPHLGSPAAARRRRDRPAHRPGHHGGRSPAQNARALGSRRPPSRHRGRRPARRSCRSRRQRRRHHRPRRPGQRLDLPARSPAQPSGTSQDTTRRIARCYPWTPSTSATTATA